MVTYTSWVVRITAASCDCTALAWDSPSTTAATVAVNIGSAETIPPPVANTGARSTNAGFDYCYQSAQDCGTGGSF